MKLLFLSRSGVRLPPSVCYQCRWNYKSYSEVASHRTYDDAIRLLNTLQTPHEILEKRRKDGIRIDKDANNKLVQCLEAIGYNRKQLNDLNIVHVAGTKGKGTTCAYVDSILLQYRQRYRPDINIGLFTSPHLIYVRERIRINSAPISPELFAKYFFHVWDALDAANISKPVYFRFLTLMSYHAFIHQGVKIAIYETGVGGEYDSTNIVEKPAVTGITSLGIDHTFSLGETIEEIAWHKAGIQKSQVPSFTVDQPHAAMAVIQERAREKGTSVILVSPPGHANVQKINANLASTLAAAVIEKVERDSLPTGTAPRRISRSIFDDGLATMTWPGRFQIIKHEHHESSVRWYLDGAHTEDSIAAAGAWFRHHILTRDLATEGGISYNIVIFNQQGHRDATHLLRTLHEELGGRSIDYPGGVSQIIFCTNNLRALRQSKDLVNHTYDAESISQLSMQTKLAETWKSLNQELREQNPAEVPSHERNSRYVEDIKVFSTVSGAIEHVLSGKGMKGKSEAIQSFTTTPHHKNEPWQPKVNVLITGSLHLVGAALSILDDYDGVLHKKKPDE